MADPNGRRMLAELLAQFDQGLLPHNEATEYIIRAARAMLDGAPAHQALDLAKRRGRPRKTLTRTEWAAIFFMIESFQRSPKGRGARIRAIRAAAGKRFGRQRRAFEEWELDRLLGKLAEIALTDEWCLTGGR